MIAAIFLSLLSFLGWFYLTFLNGRFWLPFIDAPAPEPESWPSVDIIVPARNEAEMLLHSLPSLLAQNYPGKWRVLLVNDHSTDGTGKIARQIAVEVGHANRLVVIDSPELPQGWSGKVAAMQVAASGGDSDYILFTDADIEHPADSLRRLVARSVHDRLDLNSLMVKLHCENVWEKLIIPAFVFFFAMLYPFRRASSIYSNVAAAAGGVMLVKRRALENIGGLETIKSEIIDDCALAREIKNRGGEGEDSRGNILLTMTSEVISLRVYPTLRSLIDMIARTAFTQLRYSPNLLIFTILSFVLLFIVPITIPFSDVPKADVMAFLAWALMTAIYLPTVRFYRLPLAWVLTLPVAAMIFLAATVYSAILYWQGRGGEWKGRVQAK